MSCRFAVLVWLLFFVLLDDAALDLSWTWLSVETLKWKNGLLFCFTLVFIVLFGDALPEIDFYFRSRLFVYWGILTLSIRLLPASVHEPNQQHPEIQSGLLSKHYPCKTGLKMLKRELIFLALHVLWLKSSVLRKVSYKYFLIRLEQPRLNSIQSKNDRRAIFLASLMYFSNRCPWQVVNLSLQTFPLEWTLRQALIQTWTRWKTSYHYFGCWYLNSNFEALMSQELPKYYWNNFN